MSLLENYATNVFEIHFIEPIEHYFSSYPLKLSEIQVKLLFPYRTPILNIVFCIGIKN